MPSSEDRFYGEDINSADMAEAPRRERESKVKSVAIVGGSTIVVLVVAIMLIVGSLPAVTPEQIVQRDDYEGQQQPRHIFNLYSLKQDQTRRNAEPQLQDQLLTNQASAGTAEQNTDVPVDNELVAVDSTRLPTVASSDAPTRQEIPAVVRVYEKSELRRDVTLPVVSAAVDESDNSSTNQKPDSSLSSVTVLPVYTINANQTNLRSQPNLDAAIVKLLNKGQTVSVFDSTGNWVQVATNDGAGTTGYVHKSLVEIADIE